MKTTRPRYQTFAVHGYDAIMPRSGPPGATAYVYDRRRDKIVAAFESGGNKGATYGTGVLGVDGAKERAERLCAALNDGSHYLCPLCRKYTLADEGRDRFWCGHMNTEKAIRLAARKASA